MNEVGFFSLAKNNAVMSSVKLFGHTYLLPVIANKRFLHLQQQANEQSRLIQTGTRRKRRWLTIAQFSEVPLTLLGSQERFQELNLLTHNYEAIIDELRASKDAYQLFFG